MEMFVSNLSDGWDIMMRIRNNHRNMMDDKIAEYLNLTHEEYKDILYKYGGRDINPVRITFKTKEDAEKVLKEIEPFYILAKLTGG